MSQRLTLPFKDMRITAGYKHPQYLKEWGWPHYGVDCYDPNTHDVLALGDGEVVAAGQDGPTLTGSLSRLGMVTVIVYRDVLCSDGKVRDLTARTYHHASVAVKAGDKMRRGQVIAQYGNTGANTSGPHLHIELDTDTKYPTLAPGVSVTASNRIINTKAEYARAGGLSDSTINPAKVWFIGDGQSIAGAAGSWCAQSDLVVPELPAEMPELDYKAMYEDVKACYDRLRGGLKALLK